MFEVAVLAIAAVAAGGARAPAPSSALDIEQRIAAQRAIDGVYRSHQIDRAESLAHAIPGASLEKRVRTYLRETVALERIFGAKISPEALHRELERVAAHTRFPERVEEIYDALGRDPILVEECFARPLLVGRLIRNRYAKDPVIHAAVTREADEIRHRLAQGDLDPKAPHARRREVEWQRDDAKGDGFEQLRRLVPRRVGDVSQVEETNERFVVRVLLEESARGVRVAEYEIPKVPWESWWRTVEERFDPAAASTISTGRWALPSPGKRAGSQRSEEATSAACNVSGGGWESLPGTMPAARPGHTAVWTGTEMIVWGGGEVLCDLSELQGTSTGGRYDPLTDNWHITSINGAPSTRKGHTAVWTGTEMIVWGGRDHVESGWAPLGDGARYDPETDTWSPVSMANAPSSRYGHTAVWTGTEMIVWGGKGQYCGPALNSGGRYDPATDTWRTTSTISAPLPREQHTAIWTGSEMIVWGGGNYDDFCACDYTSVLESGARYDPVADLWKALPTAGAPTARGNHTAVWTGSKMIVWGGTPYFCGELNSGGAYDPAANLWAPISSAGAPTPRCFHTAVWTGDRMVVWGGRACGTPLAMGGSYNPVLDSWSATAGGPVPRALHTAVWTGTSMIVWGGDAGDKFSVNPVADGRSYDPRSNAWTPTSNGGGPGNFSGRTAVWSGNEMIVWGGTGPGARYDAIVDAWFPTSMLGAPSGRSGHAAVWAGNRMLVWGGWEANWAHSGGRYDPISNSWESMSSGSAPTVTAAPAVWTGTEMIVWGSYSGVAAGGRYDSATDLWTPMSAVGAPEARLDHVAVWTGRQMIVYGGRTPSVFGLRTGGRYDPLADTWAPTTQVNAVANTFPRAAVWTGKEMIVFSDYGGGRYSPDTDSWGSITTAGAPPPSGSEAAVWDGASMIVKSAHYYPRMNQWSAVPSDGGLWAGSGPAVWTGTEMIIWSGAVGGRYAPGQLLDLDGDGRVSCSADCDDTDAGLWSPPSEVRSLSFDADRITLRWLPPSDEGGTAAPLYDVLRSPGPGDFYTGTTCIAPDGLVTMAVDTAVPPQDSSFFYLVRAQSSCPSGEGPLAVGPNDGIRYGRQCP